jgi:hypothetical protein
VYNLVLAVMLEAARRQHVRVERISFLDTIRWLLSAAPDERMTELLEPRAPGSA